MLADVGGWEGNKIRNQVHVPSFPPTTIKPAATVNNIGTTTSTMDKMPVQWSRTFKMDEIFREKSVCSVASER